MCGVFGNIVCGFGRDNEYSSEVEFNVIDPYFNFSRTSATVGAYENYTIPVESFGVESVEWATSDPLVSVSDGNLSVFLESGNLALSQRQSSQTAKWSHEPLNLRSSLGG